MKFELQTRFQGNVETEPDHGQHAKQAKHMMHGHGDLPRISYLTHEISYAMNTYRYILNTF